VREESTTSATGTAVTGVAPGLATDGASSSRTGQRREAQDQVIVRMPAEGAYLSVLRTATAVLAARLDFTLDEIEDLRIAVDEACAMLLSQAVPGSSLECGFTLGQDNMAIAVAIFGSQILNNAPARGDSSTISLPRRRKYANRDSTIRSASLSFGVRGQ